MHVTVVIPTLNEADVLGPVLRRVQAQPGPKDVVVVDGHSEDATPRVAREAGARVLEAPRGRGQQLNRGADATQGDALLFLHADTLLPPGALATVRTALQANEAGIFRLRFTRETPLLRLYAWATRLPWIRIAFGDRGLFAQRSAFEAVGGFPDWPIFEDLEIAHRLYAHGDFCFLDEAVYTSPRRFEDRGILRQQLRNAYLWLRYCAGADPEKMAPLYTYDDRGDEE